MTKAIWFDPKVVYPQPYTDVVAYGSNKMFIGFMDEYGGWFLSNPKDITQYREAPIAVAWTPLPNAPLTAEDFGG